MSRKLYTSSLNLFVLLILASGIHADTYSTYQTTRYFSANQQYFTELNEKKRATLYRNAPKLKPIWTRTFLELPGDVAVSNDGRRVALIDRYYGNGSNPQMTAVLILDDKGRDLASYPLKEVANLERVLQTTSSSHWYWGAGFTADSQFLIVETFTKKCEASNLIKSESDLKPANDCDRATPYERLRFASETGRMFDRSLLSAAVSR